jgi:hypothetical protein
MNRDEGSKIHVGDLSKILKTIEFKGSKNHSNPRQIPNTLDMSKYTHSHVDPPKPSRETLIFFKNTANSGEKNCIVNPMSDPFMLRIAMAVSYAASLQ